MGGSTKNQTNQTTYTLSPEQQQVLTSAMGQYMPNGQLPSQAPQFNYNSNADLQNVGSNYIAPLSSETNAAIGDTVNAVGAQQPTMDIAKLLTGAATGSTGQAEGLTDGWTTDPTTGQATYQSFNQGVANYMSPYTNDVINTGLGFLETSNLRNQLATDNSSVSNGSFGGTRQAVRNALDDTSFAAQAENLISSNLNTGFNNAVQQYNTGLSQGQGALSYNAGIQQAQNAANLAAGQQLGNQALQNQMLTGNDINALSGAGSIVQAEDQSQRDAARGAQMQDATYGLGVAQALAGLAPPPSSTTTTSTPNSSMWASMGGSALVGLGAMMSDERSKTDVRESDPEDALDAIRKLKPKTFQYKPEYQQSMGLPSGKRTGFMAQDLEKASGIPNPTMKGLQHVDIGEHIGRLTQAVQALDSRMSIYGGKGVTKKSPVTSRAPIYQERAA